MDPSSSEADGQVRAELAAWLGANLPTRWRQRAARPPADPEAGFGMPRRRQAGKVDAGLTVVDAGATDPPAGSAAATRAADCLRTRAAA